LQQFDWNLGKMTTDAQSDDLDARLLGLLRRDGRASTAALARRLGVARSTVQARMERLERRGVIAGYTVVHAPEYEAKLVRAHVMIRVDAQGQTQVERALGAMDAVSALYTISGAHDFVAVLRSDSTQALDAAIDAIRNVEGVLSTTSSVLLARKFER
jgi:DNA-binding Lrp family transcriptional regulator